MSEVCLGRKIVFRIVMNGQAFHGPQISWNWDVRPCILVEIHGHIEEACCLRFHGRRTQRKLWQHIPPKRQLFHNIMPLSSVNSFHPATPHLVAILLICSSKHTFFFRIVTSFQFEQLKSFDSLNSMHATCFSHLTIPSLSVLLTSDSRSRVTARSKA